MMHIMTVVGARPQFIKAAVLSRLIRSDEYRGRMRETLVHTGQHYDENMSEVFFREMDIPRPDHNLAVGSGSHGAMTGAMLAGIERLILEEKPDLVLVYGDTNSTLAGALAAAKLHVPVAHVEAGLRSYMMAMPEEQNRRLTDQLSSWLFCPTQTAARNLAKEGIEDADLEPPTPDAKAVKVVGDVMLDASLYYRRQARESEPGFSESLPEAFTLLTIHRAENTDDPKRLAGIVRAVNALGDRRFIFPAHPRTRKILGASGLEFGPHVSLIDPVGYRQMLILEDRCSLVLTDSGGVQKEAYFFGKPCVTLRDATEWVELVDAGWNVLAGAEATAIVAAVKAAATPGDRPELYGRGDAGRHMLDALAAAHAARR